MDFDAAIKAHSDWKLKLSSYLRKRDGSLDHNVVCKDNSCALGQWIQGEGTRNFAGLALFQTLKSDHTRFHRAAADIVRKANTGLDVVEQTALGSTSEFSVASKSVVASIVKMKSEVARRVPA